MKFARKSKQKKIRRRIITETRHVALLIDSGGGIDSQECDLIFCQLCGSDNVAMISPLMAAKIMRIGTREIYRLIETGKIHFIEMPAPDSRIFVCSKSLEKKMDK